MAARNVAFVALAMAALVGVHAVVPADNTDMHETHDWLNEFNDLEQLVYVGPPLLQCPLLCPFFSFFWYA